MLSDAVLTHPWGSVAVLCRALVSQTVSAARAAVHAAEVGGYSITMQRMTR